MFYILTQDSKNRRSRAFAPLDTSASGTCELKLYVGGNETIPMAQREQNVVRARCMASRMLGKFNYAKGK